MVEHSGVKWTGPKTKWVMIKGLNRVMFFVGMDFDGDAVFYDGDGDYQPWLEKWKDEFIELPDCTGFDYVPEPEPVYPAWCLPKEGGELSGYRKQVAYYRYDSKNSGMTVHKDGTSFRWNDGRDFTDYARRVVTQQEAEERVEVPNVEQHKATSRTIGSDGNDERDAAAEKEFVTFFEVVREGALGREVVFVEHPGGLWHTGQTRNMRVK